MARCLGTAIHLHTPAALLTAPGSAFKDRGPAQKGAHVLVTIMLSETEVLHKSKRVFQSPSCSP